MSQPPDVKPAVSWGKVVIGLWPHCSEEIFYEAKKIRIPVNDIMSLDVTGFRLPR